MPPTARLDARNPAHIARAAKLLREGGTVAFPTETVYGLGANALDPAAIEKIFAAKQRPHWDPLIVHIADLAMLPQVARVESRVAWELIARFWPGPLTLLLPRVPQIHDVVTAGRPLVGVRMPNHSVALELTRQAGVPIAAPSANTFGHTSPTTAAHVLADLDGRIDAVLDGGATEVGVESTVVEITGSGLTVYRPGGISLAQLDEIVGPDRSRLYSQQPIAEDPVSLPSPGVGLRHYAPRAELILCQVRKSGPEAERSLLPWIEANRSRGMLGVMLPAKWARGGAPLVYDWGPWERLDRLASGLFAGLRSLDEQGASVILCPVPDAAGLGLAIQDRLYKAARRR